MRYLMLIFLLCGCSSRIGDFTLMATRNVGHQIDLSKAEAVGEFEGCDVGHIVVLFSTGEPNAEDALDMALGKAQGHLMTDGVYHYNWWYIPYIYGRKELAVKGMVWRLPGLPRPRKILVDEDDQLPEKKQSEKIKARKQAEEDYFDNL